MKVFKKMSDDTYYGFDSFWDYLDYMITYIIFFPVGVVCGIGAVWVLFKVFEYLVDQMYVIGNIQINQ